MRSYRIGVDVGGTFTDLVLLDEETGRIEETKVLTTSPNPADGCLEAIRRAIGKAGAKGEEVRVILHGTTIATNSLLERKGARTALITTRGFRDVLEIGRQIRPSLFDWHADKPEPLVRRKWRYEVGERLRSDGSVMAEIDPREVEAVARQLQEEGIEAVAVSLLFSFLNPRHEQLVEEVLRRELPGRVVSLSSRVLPEYREYERTSTVCANAFITPVLDRYTREMNRALSELALDDRLRLLQSNGGIATVQSLREQWVNTVLSGPAGGVAATAFLARQKQAPDLISMDIGGTSCDISLIRGYLPGWTAESSICGLPIRAPMIDVQSVGAGGGSVIWVDSGGALRVGPRSTGSHPGPVCFGQGGREAAVTDAHLILGAVHADSFADKGIAVDAPAALAALEELGRPFGLPPQRVATGALEVMNHHIAQSIRMQVMSRGFELSSFALVAFGGAGPLHACPIAELLGIRKVLMPNSAGVFSALGAALADYRYDFVQACPGRLAALGQAEIQRILNGLMEQARAKVQQIPVLEVRYDRSVDLRYLGQSFEINVPVDGEASGGIGLEEIMESFHRLHEENYGYCDRSEPVELVNVRLSCFGLTSKPRLVNPSPAGSGAATPETVEILAPGREAPQTHVILRRENLGSGERICGPCLVLNKTSTALISEGWSGSIDEIGTIELMRGVKHKWIPSSWKSSRIP